MISSKPSSITSTKIHFLLPYLNDTWYYPFEIAYHIVSTLHFDKYNKLPYSIVNQLTIEEYTYGKC